MLLADCVLFIDAEAMILDKPAGLAVDAPRDGSLSVMNHLDSLRFGFERLPSIVHRLDRDTSGLLVVARSDHAHEKLQDLIRRREVDRHYLALVKGKPRSRSGRIEAPIGRDRQDRTRHSLDTPTPRDAVTWFEVVETFARHTLLDVKLETGRTHQIRVHLEAIELPVAGDPVYGTAGDLGLERQFLHAARLDFQHPFTGERVETASPLPNDLDGALERARAL